MKTSLVFRNLSITADAVFVSWVEWFSTHGMTLDEIFSCPDIRKMAHVAFQQTFFLRLIIPMPNSKVNKATLTSFAKASLGFYREKIPHLDENCHVVDLSVTKDYVRRGKVNICPCLRVNSSRFYVTTLRRYLTTRECLRLQGFPDSWESVCSDTQTRKQCGNAMSVNVLVKLFQRILTEIS